MEVLKGYRSVIKSVEKCSDKMKVKEKEILKVINRELEMKLENAEGTLDVNAISNLEYYVSIDRACTIVKRILNQKFHKFYEQYKDKEYLTFDDGIKFAEKELEIILDDAKDELEKQKDNTDFYYQNLRIMNTLIIELHSIKNDYTISK